MAFAGAFSGILTRISGTAWSPPKEQDASAPKPGEKRRLKDEEYEEYETNYEDLNFTADSANTPRLGFNEPAYQSFSSFPIKPNKDLPLLGFDGVGNYWDDMNLGEVRNRVSMNVSVSVPLALKKKKPKKRKVFDDSADEVDDDSGSVMSSASSVTRKQRGAKGGAKCRGVGCQKFSPNNFAARIAKAAGKTSGSCLDTLFQPSLSQGSSPSSSWTNNQKGKGVAAKKNPSRSKKADLESSGSVEPPPLALPQQYQNHNIMLSTTFSIVGTTASTQTLNIIPKSHTIVPTNLKVQQVVHRKDWVILEMVPGQACIFQGGLVHGGTKRLVWEETCKEGDSVRHKPKLIEDPLDGQECDCDFCKANAAGVLLKVPLVLCRSMWAKYDALRYHCYLIKKRDGGEKRGERNNDLNKHEKVQILEGRVFLTSF